MVGHSAKTKVGQLDTILTQQLIAKLMGFTRKIIKQKHLRMIS